MKCSCPFSATCSPSARCSPRPTATRMRQHLEKARVDEARIAELERAIDAGDAELEPLRVIHRPGRIAKGGGAARRAHRVPPRRASGRRAWRATPRSRRSS